MKQIRFIIIRKFTTHDQTRLGVSGKVYIKKNNKKSGL